MRKKTRKITSFILSNVSEFPANIVAKTCDKFGISRQAAARHMRRLADEGLLDVSGTTRDRRYQLAILKRWDFFYEMSETLSESSVWNKDIKPILGGLSENVLNIWYTGFTEMFNNVIDHSLADTACVMITKTAINYEITISDNGVGIFKKIQDALKLMDERHAALELAKGKFTTDPENHTGYGIFFSYHAFDFFSIVSGSVYLLHYHEWKEDYIYDKPERVKEGTTVFLKLYNDSIRTMKEVYDEFSSEDDYSFSKTIIPVKLAEYGDDKLVSRSQAKRVLVRLDRFETAIFDFTGVEYIGQAFADEIFRVFQNSHPDIEIISFNETDEVKKMVIRARTKK